MIIKASDIRQHIYCPRETYYEFVVPAPKPLTYKMTHGKKEHIKIEELERRRNLSKYNLKDGEKIFSPNLFSSKLQLSGKPDLIIMKENSAFPIDYKFSTNAYLDMGWKMQITTYSKIVEAEWGVKSDVGFIYFVNQDSVRSVDFNDELIEKLENTLRSMREIIEKEMFPEPPKNKNKCRDCRFRRWCGDI